MTRTLFLAILLMLTFYKVDAQEIGKNSEKSQLDGEWVNDKKESHWTSILFNCTNDIATFTTSDNKSFQYRYALSRDSIVFYEIDRKIILERFKGVIWGGKFMFFMNFLGAHMVAGFAKGTE